MLMAILAIVAGLILLAWSADRFIEGAAATAFHLGMPTLLVGILIIGFGTSAPEMIVSAIASGQGNPGLSLGNAYGSNIANIGLILGISALISPMLVHSQLLRQELPLLAAVTLLSAGLLLDSHISRLDAVLLLVVLLAFIGWSILRSRRGNATPDASVGEGEAAVQAMSLRQGIVWTLVGLVILVGSSRLLVWGAVDIAQALGVSDLIIGLTVVAIGTSLPELASSISAIRKNKHDMVLGNVIGSNLYNTLGVVGLAGVITPIHSVADAMTRDWPVMAGLTLAMVIFCIGWRGPGRVTRLEGGALFVVYLAYTSYLAWTAVSAHAV